MYASTRLYRDRWYGPEFLDDDDSTANTSDWVASISVWWCAGAGTYTYRSYTANTDDNAQFSC